MKSTNNNNNNFSLKLWKMSKIMIKIPTRIVKKNQKLNNKKKIKSIKNNNNNKFFLKLLKMSKIIKKSITRTVKQNHNQKKMKYLTKNS